MLTPKRKPRDEGPLVGALLRLAYAELSARVLREAQAAGFRDVNPRHWAAFQLLHDRPEGARPTEIAAAARVTKQSMAATLDQLVELGYVERVADPTDKRAQVLRATKRGVDAMRTARAIVRGVERDWARRLGAARFEAMRGALEELVASFEGEGEG
jgi:DNA-binding MarR family transcriptional regulator